GLVARLRDKGRHLLARGGAGPASEPPAGGMSRPGLFDFSTDLAGGPGAPSDHALPIAELTQRIHADDRDRLLATFELAVRGRDGDGAFRLSGGQWIALRFRSLRDDDGALCGVTVSGEGLTPRPPMTQQAGPDPVSGLT